MAELLPLALLAALLALHLVGSVRVDRRASRRTRGRRAARAGCFATGLLLLAIALSPPVDGVADRSVAAHMAQHLVLLVVAPPLIVWSEPLPALVTALPRGLRRGVGSAAAWLTGRRIGIGTVIVATELHVGLMILWHAPPFYDAAHASELVHAVEHVSFLASGLFFWSCIARLARRGASGCAIALGATVAANVQSGLLGILMTLASSPWYSAEARPPFGLSPLADQQAAGAEMWVVAGGVYVLAAALLAAGIVRTPADQAAAPPDRSGGFATRRARREARTGSPGSDARGTTW